jgi:archaellum component FlaC
MPSSTQTCDNLSLDNTALNALLYDIKYETSPTETDVHQNKFYHWLADRLNHRMGDIGSYIKQAQNQLEQPTGLASSKVLALENTIKDAEAKVVSIQNAVNTTLETVHQLMKELEEQVEEHLKHG